MEKKYPIRFLDAYRREDIDFFFGRNEEIETLYQMTQQANIVLVYGTSGTGKTSLIQCGLANKFQTYDWLALNIRRGKNMIASLDKALCKESDDVYKYSKSKSLKIDQLESKIEAVYQSSFKPIYLIFDQFEELYILGNKEEQKAVIKAFKQILLFDQPVKIIISIREEYLGYLYEFEKEIPDLLRKKLRVEPMNLNKVGTVIKGIGNRTSSNIKLESGKEDKISGIIFNKIRGDEQKRTIELPYLQVFLDNLYLQITKDESRKSDALITLAEVKKIGNIGDVLRDFLDKQVQLIASNFKEKPDFIWRVLSPFVTLDGTKDPMSAEMLHRRLANNLDIKQTNKILKAFTENRILRYTEQDQLFEISHDSLAKQVHAKRSDEEIAILEVQRLIRSQVALKQEAREPFTEKQLMFIEPYLEKFNPDKDELNWIEKSRSFRNDENKATLARQQEELKKAKQQATQERKLRESAERAKMEADFQKLQVEKARDDAEDQKVIAINKAKQSRQRTRLAVVISIVAILLTALAYWLSLKAGKSERKALYLTIKADSLTQVAINKKNEAVTARLSADSIATEEKRKSGELTKANADLAAANIEVKNNLKKVEELLDQVNKQKDTISNAQVIDKKRLKELDIASRKLEEQKDSILNLFEELKIEQNLSKKQKQEKANEQLKQSIDNIYSLNYSFALIACKESLELGVDSSRVENVIHELAFFYHESGQDSLAREVLKILNWNEQINLDTLLEKINPKYYHDTLIARYFPKLIYVNGGTYLTELDTQTTTYLRYPSYESVENFYIGETEITFWQYNLFTSYMSNHPEKQKYGNSIISNAGSVYSGDHPAIYVSWLDAIDYCNWLSDRENNLKRVYYRKKILEKNYEKSKPLRKPVMDTVMSSILRDEAANGFRLPTEEEWEFSAKGGKNVNSFSFSGSESIDEVGWYKKNSGSQTHPVKQKMANSIGIYDMTGNASEWIWCWICYEHNFKIFLKGGDFALSAEDNKVFKKTILSPSDATHRAGFRIVQSIK